MSLDLDGKPFLRDDGDNRVTCTDCRALTPNGHCRVAARGERQDVSREYGPPVPYLPWRCPFFEPKPNATDQRGGRERFPELYAEYEARIAERNRVRREASARGIGRAKAAVDTS